MAMPRTEQACQAKGVSSTRRDLPAYFCIAICIYVSHLVVGVAAATCPRKCECIWRDGKSVVDCSNQGLGSIPTDVDVSSQALNISGNHIPLFNERQFSRFGMTNLQKISASNCGLGQIHRHAFQGLTNLVELYLDNNNLAEVPHEALAGDAPSLMTLNLRHNTITRIPSQAFRQLTSLKKLDLSENKIQVVESGAFEGLSNLERIYLHANRISNLDARDFSTSLQGITLHDNRWSCDCHQRSFRLWLTQSNVARPVEPVCHGPRRLIGIRIPSLSLAEFACAPQLSPTSMYLTVPQGKNVSIVCRVASDPLSEIIWYFNGNRIKDATIRYQQGTIERTAQQDNYAWSHHASASIQPWEPSDVGHGRSSNSVNRILRHDIISESETRSELLIHNTSVRDNGTYHCQAENKAARSVSNFTLHVTNHIDTPKILQLRLEYFVAVAVGVILILVLIIMAVAVLLIRLCRRRIKSKQSEMMKADERNGSSSTLYGAKKVGPMPAKMPKHIRMGTGGFRNPQPTTSIAASSQQSLNPYLNSTISDRPDLLTDHSLSSTGKGSKVASTGTMSSESSRVSSGSQPISQQGSYRMAMENIIDDYRLSNPPELRTKPLIGSTSLNDQGKGMSRAPAARPLSSVMSDCLRGSSVPFPDSCVSRSGRDLLGIDPRIVDALEEGGNGRYPVDYGLPRSPPMDPSNLRAFANPNYRHHPHSNTLPHHYHSYQSDQLLARGQPSFSLGHHPMGTVPSHYFRPQGGTTTLDALALWQYQQLQNQISHQPQSLHPNFLRTKQVLPDEKYPDEDSRHAIMSDHHLYQSLPVRSFIEGSHPTPLGPILSQASHPAHLQLSEPLYTPLQNTSNANHLQSGEQQNKPPYAYPSDRQMDMSHYETIGRNKTSQSMKTMMHPQQQQQPLPPITSSISPEMTSTTSSSQPIVHENTRADHFPSDTIPSESINNSVFSSLPTIKSSEDQTQSTYLAPLAEQEDGGTTSGAGSSSWTSEAPSTVPLVEDFSPSEETRTDEVDQQEKGKQANQTRNPLAEDNDQSTSNLHFQVQPTSWTRSMENDASHPGKTDVKASSEPQHERKPETTRPLLSQPQLVTTQPNEKPKNDGHNLLSNDTRELTDQQNENGSASQGDKLEGSLKDKKEPTVAAFQSVQSSYASETGDDVGSDSSLQLISTSQGEGEEEEEVKGNLTKSDPRSQADKLVESSDESLVGMDTLKIYQELDDAFISLDQEVNNFEAGVNDSS